MTDPSPRESCPAATELESYVASGTRDGSTHEHVRRCDRCLGEVKRIKADNELIADYVSANADRYEPDTTQARFPQIAGYELTREVYRGAQGVVYDAVQKTTKRRVAVKTLAQGAFATSRQRRRFEREVELIAALRHPHIVTIYDSGRTLDGGHFLAMEYVEGVPLDRFLRGSLRCGPRKERLAMLRRRLELFEKVCDGINTAHQRGIMHRDLKPDNILVDEAGDPHVLDFGLAKRANDGGFTPIPQSLPPDDDDTTGTIIGEFLGTFAYASPEQASADPAEIDIRSDVYALGILLFEMLTGKRPYVLAGSMDDVIATIRNADTLDARSLNDVIDADLDAILARAMAKNREARYQSAGELREEVRRYLAGEPVAARGHSPRYVLARMIARHKVAATIIIIVALLAPFAIIAVGWLVVEANAADRTADAERERDLLAATMEEMIVALHDRKLDARSADAAMRGVRDAWNRIIDERLSDTPHLEARARASLARVALSQDDPALADALATTALDLQERLGDEPLRVADTLHVLGQAKLALGRPAEAKPRFERALDLRSALLPPGDERITQTRALLAQCGP